jgi:hypothetical protein
MCRPCLSYTAYVYRDDVTLDLGRYYIYDLDGVGREIERYVRETRRFYKRRADVVFAIYI